MTLTRWKQACIATKKAAIKKANGQIQFPTDRALNDVDKIKTGLHRDKKTVMKRRKEIPLPTDRALNDADRVTKVLYRDKKHKCIKKIK